MSALLTKPPESSAYIGPQGRPMKSGCRERSAQGCESLVKDLEIQMPRRLWLLWWLWGCSVPELNAWKMGRESPELEVVVACSRSRGCLGTPYVMLAGEKCTCNSEWLCLT